MLRASFQFSLPVSAVLAALCPGGGGGEGDPAAILGKVQRLRECFERGDTHSDVENYVESSVRWGKLFPQSGPSVGPAPSWLPTELPKETAEAAESYLRSVHNVPYSLEAWNAAVVAGTTLLRRCQGWKHAVGALRFAWRARGEDHFSGLFDHHLDDHMPEDLLASRPPGKGCYLVSPWRAPFPAVTPRCAQSWPLSSFRS